MPCSTALADPTFPKNSPFSRFSDAGKLMALASFSVRSTPSADEKQLIDFLLQDCPHLELSVHGNASHLRYHNVGVEDPEFRTSPVFLATRCSMSFINSQKRIWRKEFRCSSQVDVA